MTPEQLLQECELLTYSGRMRRMVELGQLAASDNSISETLTELAQGDVYQRTLAAQACYGSRNSAQALKGLSDPSRSVRSLTINLIALICSDDELQVALDTVPLDMKIILLRRLRQRQRPAPIDRHLEALASRGSEELKELLPFASRKIIERYLGQISERLDLTTLCRFARSFPDLVVAHLHARAKASTNVDPILVVQVNIVLPLLAKHAPDLALDLLKALITTIPLARLNVQPLVIKHPKEVADLLFQTDDQSNLRFGGVAHRLDVERLRTLFTQYPNTISSRHFEKLRPEMRLALYTACERGWRNAEGILSYHIIAALPTAQRLQEGRRHLELPTLLARPQERLPYAAFLPWDEARALLDTPSRSPDADLRGVALQALIATTRYQREHLAEILQLIRNRRNEQDPVRQKMLTALSELPHSIWQAAHLEDLAAIIHDALNATDLSRSTAQAIERLVVHLFPFHPEWSALQIAIIYRARGSVSFFHLESYLSNADILRIAPTLTPILQSWQNRENERLLVLLAQSLGKRMSVFDELANLLESTLDRTLNNGIATSILRIFVEHRHERIYPLIPRLLEEDRSTITLEPVYMHLHRHRQDLLTPFLGQHAYKGRFSTGKTRTILPFHDGFYCWTPTQQHIFAQTILEIVDKKEQNRATYELTNTIHRLAAMPSLDPALIIQFANDERQPVRETALRELGTLDAGQGIPTLIEALNDERARIAIYALRDALLSMPQEKALDYLRAVPFTQVTVAKEVVRLIGELSSSAAYRELLAIASRQLHRDVRVALLRALWPYTENEETWEIFTRAAQDPEAALARGVVHLPEDGMSPVALRRLTELTATLLAHPDPEVRMATLQWRSQHPITDNDQILFARLLSLLHSHLPDECEQAASAVFATYTGNSATLVETAIRDLLPNRRPLQIAIESFAYALGIGRRRLLPTTRAILRALAEDPLTLSLRIGLIVGGLPWEEVAPELIKLSPTLHASALIGAQHAIQQAYTRPEARLFELEMAFAKNEDERLRLLAFAALVAQTNQANGWSDECIARLQAYREDPSPMVAEAAQFTFVR